MKKRILSLMLAFAIAAGNVAVVKATETDNPEPKAAPCPVGDTILAASDFNQGVQKEFELNGENIGIRTSPDGESCIEMSLDTYHQIGKMYDAPFEKGIYSFSFDFYAQDYVSEIVLRAYNEAAKNFGDTGNMAMLARFTTDGRLNIYRNTNTAYTDHELWYPIEKDRWHSFSLWVDTENNEMAYWLNGELWATMPLHERIISPKGFAVVHNAASKSDKKWYFDNMKICREESGMSGGLLPAYISYTTAEDVVSNNFYKDMPPRFDLSFKNRTKNEIEAEYFYRIKSYDGLHIFTSESTPLTIPTDKIVEKNLKVEPEYYNRCLLDVVLKIDGKEYVKTIMYSNSNRKSTEPVNRFTGMNTHLYQSRGTPEMAIPLMGRAGIGNIRDQLGAWAFPLGEKEWKFFDLCDEYDIDIMLYTTNAPVSMQEGDCRFVGENHMQEYQDAVTEWAKTVGDKVYALEIGNESHNPGMTGQYHARFDVQANWMRYAHRGIQAAGSDILVVGIDEDNAGFNYKPSTKYYEGTPYGDYDSYVQGVLDHLKGEQVMDVISIHPYPATAEDLKGHRLVNQAREMLAAAKLDPDVPVFFTESGFSEYNFEYDHKAVAAQMIRKFLRWQTTGLCDVIHYFHFDDNMRAGGTLEGHWGLVEDMQPGSSEIPGLGKIGYVAAAYYNSLAAGMTPVSNIDDENKYLIHFKHRDGQDIVATGIIDDKEETVGIYLGCDSVTMTDMCGNEKTLYGVNGVFTLELKENEITYLKGNFKTPKFTEPKFKLEKPVYTVPVDYSYEYAVSVPNGFKGTVEATATGVELEKASTEIKNNKAGVKLKTLASAQDSARIDLSVTRDGRLYYYRWNNITYSASGFVDEDSIKWRLSGNSDDLWNLSFNLENVRTDIPISGKMTVAETGKTYELPSIDPGTSRKITIPMNRVKRLSELGTVNAQINFTDTDIFNLKLDSDIAVAKWTDTPPEIDGVIGKDEYTSDAVALILDSTDHVDGGIWNGKDDLNYKVYLTYDNDYLYIAAKVQDDMHHYEIKDIEQIWQNDSIQFLVGFTPGVTGTQITAALIDGKPSMYRYYHENNIMGLNGSDAKCVYEKAKFDHKITGNEAVFEIAMPWNDVRDGYSGGIKQGQRVFFDICYNDSDGSGRRYWMEYAGAIAAGYCQNNNATELLLLPKK